MDVNKQVWSHHNYLKVGLRRIFLLHSTNHLGQSWDSGNFKNSNYLQQLRMLFIELLPWNAAYNVN
jgi:hypothetical protein